MRTLIAIILVFITLLGCQETNYKSYSISPTGLNYRLISIGDPELTIADSDVVTFYVTILDSAQEVLFNGKVSQLFISKKDTGLMELLSLLVVGDSASAYINSTKISNILPNVPIQLVRLDVGVTHKQPYTTWLFHERYPELLHDLEINEQVTILQLLRQYQLDSIEVLNGMFIIRKVVGTGTPIQTNDEVWVHYVAYTPEGKILDSTYERNQPLSFVIGQQDQVLPGFEIGIRKMREGEKAMFIIPSKLAFGSKGASTGIAKGYEVLIFDVDIVNVIKSENIISITG